MIRVKDWLYSFLPMIFGNLYLFILVLDIPFNARSIILLALSFIVSAGFASVGYLINEASDIASDQASGKNNQLAGVSKGRLVFLLTCSLLFCLLPWLWLPFDSKSLALILAQFLSYLLYSLPPFRWKKNPFLSIILDSLYAYILPLFLAANTFILFSDSYFHSSFLLLFFLLYLLIGCRNIIVHQIKDIFKDQLSNITTLPRLLGVKKANRILINILRLEALLSFIWIGILTKQSSPYFIFLIIPLLFELFELRKSWKNRLSNYIVYNNIRQGLNFFFQVWVPYFLILLLGLKNWYWFGLAVAHSLFFLDRVSFSKLYSSIRNVLSVVVNYSLFYFFKLFGRDLRKKPLFSKK